MLYDNDLHEAFPAQGTAHETEASDPRPGPSHRERKCADTIDTAVFLGWPFQMLKYQYIFQIRYTEAVLPNITRKLMV